MAKKKKQVPRTVQDMIKIAAKRAKEERERVAKNLKKRKAEAEAAKVKSEARAKETKARAAKNSKKK